MNSFLLKKLFSENSEIFIANWNEKLLGEMNREFLAITDNVDIFLKNFIRNQETIVETTIINNVLLSAHDLNLFIDVVDWKNNTRDMRKIVDRIYKITFLYSSKNSKFYKKEELFSIIEYSLNWIHNNIYNKKINTFGNWWDWEIGIPSILMNILSLLHQEAGLLAVKKQLSESIKFFIPDPYVRLIGVRGGEPKGHIEKGANLIDKIFILILNDLINGKSDEIMKYIYSINKLIEFVEYGDGFYDDGSFIQHENLGYTENYGQVLLDKISNLCLLFRDHDLLGKIIDINLTNTHINKTFMPILYKCRTLSISNGRCFSRKDIEQIQGINIVSSIFIINKFLAIKNEKFDNLLVDSVTYLSKTEQLLLDNIGILNAVIMIAICDKNKTCDKKELIVNENIALSAMCRMVDHRTNYSAAVNLFSPTISAMEYGNGEGKQGFYLGCGVLSIYNTEFSYSNDFWPTVGMTELAGTITDHKIGELISWKRYFNPHDFVGFVSNENQGLASMFYSMKQVTGSELSARKSYFFLENQIIVLVTDLTNVKRETFSIIENRKITDIKKNQFIVDGKPVLIGDNFKFENVTWAHLQGINDLNSIGYVFLQSTNVSCYKKYKSGSWKNLNDQFSEEIISKPYVGLNILHSETIEHAKYGYMILPGASLQSTQNCSRSPLIKVLSNNSEVQAIQDNKTLSIMAAFYTKATLDDIIAHTSGLIILTISRKNISIALSDPTKKLSVIHFSIKNYTMKSLLNFNGKQNEISVNNEDNFLDIKIFPENNLGKTYILNILTT